MVRSINCFEETTTLKSTTTFTFKGCEWSECVEIKNNDNNKDLCNPTTHFKHRNNTGCFPPGKFALGAQSICCKKPTLTTITTKLP